MTTVLVTGCAGFLGSRVALACLERGDNVLGADAFTDFYDPAVKRANLAALDRYRDRLDFRQVDLADGADELVEGVDVIFHLAGQPGVRDSWREQFDEYVRCNVLATQRLLESAARFRVPRVVYASSSSIYGNADTYPVDESTTPRPYSPYGVTKLAAEHMCSLYAENFGLSVVSLRYFTVYGPGQRPDMATRRLIDAALTGQPFTLLGTGEQIRDFTYVDDVVAANLLAADADIKPGLIANIAGGGGCTMNELIDLVGEIVGTPVPIERHDSVSGDVIRTGGATDRAERHLGWAPSTDLRTGLARQVDWQRG